EESYAFQGPEGRVTLVDLFRGLNQLIVYHFMFHWYSSYGTTFNHDLGATVGDSEHHRLSVFVRDGERVYLTYQTFDRGVEALGTTFSLLDLVPYGRQESWEDSPPGWPQGDAYVWWRRKDEYERTGVPAPSTLR